jgi:hypothetical protein
MAKKSEPQWLQETHPGVMEAHPGAVEARLGTVESHLGGVVAHPEAMEANPEVVGLTPELRGSLWSHQDSQQEHRRLTLQPWRLTPEPWMLTYVPFRKKGRNVEENNSLIFQYSEEFSGIKLKVQRKCGSMEVNQSGGIMSYMYAMESRLPKIFTSGSLDSLVNLTCQLYCEPIFTN